LDMRWFLLISFWTISSTSSSRDLTSSSAMRRTAVGKVRLLAVVVTTKEARAECGANADDVPMRDARRAVTMVSFIMVVGVRGSEGIPVGV
jgi:hypothetical protein